MIDLDQTHAAACAAFPEKDSQELRQAIVACVKGVRNDPPERGDFSFHATYGIHVQQIWFEEEDAPGPVEVFLKVGCDYDDYIANPV